MNVAAILEERIVLKNEIEKLGQDNLILAISICYFVIF